MLNPSQLTELRQRVDALMLPWYERHQARTKSDGQQCGPIEFYCLFWAVFTVRALRDMGIKAQIQAGSAYWPIMTLENDDGVSANQFGYEFEWSPQLAMEIADGKPPEWHVWAAVVESPPFILDVTARYFKGRAAQAGHKVGADVPDAPPVFQATERDMPWGVAYRADIQAIELAYAMIQSYNGAPLMLRVHPKGQRL